MPVSLMLSGLSERLAIALQVFGQACTAGVIGAFIVGFIFGPFSTVVLAEDSHDKAAIASPQTTYRTLSATLPTTLLYDFFRLRRAELELDRNEAVARFVTGLQMEDRIALAQLLLDDRDIRVRAFAIATLVNHVGFDATRTELGAVAKRIGLASILRAERYAALKYDMPGAALETLSAPVDMQSENGGDLK